MGLLRNAGQIVALVSMATAPAAAASEADDLLCMRVMTEGVAIANSRANFPPDAVSRMENAAAYFLGTSAGRYDESELVEALKASKAEFTKIDRKKLYIDCDAKYSKALKRMMEATQKAQ
jgi:hypothetical protein